VGATPALFGLLADTATAVQRFVSVFVGVYVLLIFAYVLASWFRPPAALLPVVRFLDETTGPYLRLFRRIIPPLGPIDLSPIVAVFVLFILERVVNALVGGIL
jgi:uncharacterized protein YggT (Ycf19 family)